MKTCYAFRIGLAPLFILVAAWLLTSCGKETKPAIVLIAVDTLRADVLGAYGASPSATPCLDRLAEEAVTFSQAYSQSPWTLPSFASLFTATLPSKHGAGEQERPGMAIGQKKFLPIRSDLTTAAQSFQANGYQTAAFVNNIFLKGDFGFDRGFELFDFFGSGARKVRKAEKVTDLAMQWLNTRGRPDRPYLLFLHYFDPHFTYQPPTPFLERFDAKITKRLQEVRHPEQIRNGSVPLSEDDRTNLRNLYLGEVAYTDREVGRLLDELRDSGRIDESVVIVLSDHGEEFWDHGDFEHGHTQFEELIHVPLLIRFPDKKHAGTTVAEPVRLMDLMPTLFEYFGLTPPDTFDGQSFLSLLQDGHGYDVPFLFENCLYGTEKKAIRSNDLKLIVDMQSDDAALFDLSSDPKEQNDLAATRAEEVERLKASLLQSVEETDADRGAENQALDLPPRIMQDLKDLGYVR